MPPKVAAEKIASATVASAPASNSTNPAVERHSDQDEDLMLLYVETKQSKTNGPDMIGEPVAKKRFYIVAHLPYSIRLGEVAAVTVMIYNFFGNALITNVHLYNKNNEFEFLNPANETTHRSKMIKMPKIGCRHVTFLIKAIKIGEIAIKIETVNNYKQDFIEHMLRVEPEPEGHLYENNVLRFFEHSTHKLTHESVQLNIPKKYVFDSVKIGFNLDPRFVMIPIANVERLLHTPKGYGKAVLNEFIIYVIALDYVSKAGLDESNLKRKLINALKTGYNYQMRCKLKDGSFSESMKYKKGSIFITSLVAKFFMIASEHVKGLVNIDTVDAALEWIASKQQSDGSFEEDGDQIHNVLQGRLRVKLTAYALIAFLETGELASKYSANIDSAVEYLVKNHNRMGNVYDLVLTAYALSLKKHITGKNCLEKVVERSKEAGGERYWNEGPFSIEVASYAVLTSLRYYPSVEASPIIKWLIKQRSVTGDFDSVQNTFIGLQAMAQFALKTSVNAYDYRISLKLNNLRRIFDISKYEARQHYSYVVPSDVRKVDVEITGIGLGLYQVAYQYRCELEDVEPGFGLDLVLMDSSTYHVQNLKICTKHMKRRKDTESSSAYVDVFFPSGLHIMDSKAITDLGGRHKIKDIELKNRGTNVRVHYNSLDEFDSCFIVRAERRSEVALHRPGYVTVHDTVYKDILAYKKYEGIVSQPCDICSDEDRETMACNVA